MSPSRSAIPARSAKRAASRCGWLPIWASTRRRAAGSPSSSPSSATTSRSMRRTAGSCVAGVTFEGRPQVEVLSIDRGPGMADVERCLRDGYSTGGTPGTGLGAIRRQSDRFSVFSESARGTVIVAGVSARTASAAPAPAAGRYSWAGVGVAAPREAISGDGWSVQIAGDRLQALMADGLGHGVEAAQVADAAVAAFDARTDPTPAATIERIHAALRGSRGAAIAAATLDAGAGRLVFCGAGNIAGRILSGIVRSCDAVAARHRRRAGAPCARRRIPMARACDRDPPLRWNRHALDFAGLRRAAALRPRRDRRLAHSRPQPRPRRRDRPGHRVGTDHGRRRTHPGARSRRGRVARRARPGRAATQVAAGGTR